MSDSPCHLMISGLDDADPYRMSAKKRGEKYKHIDEITEADKFLEDFDIVYVDSSYVYRVINDNVVAIDVRSERLSWLTEKATSNPSKLFVIIWDEKEGWGELLEKGIAKKYSNIVIHNSQPNYENISSFLENIVDEWEVLVKS